MATHSNTLAWEIPWTEEPSRLSSTRLQDRTRLVSNLTTKLPLPPSLFLDLAPGVGPSDRPESSAGDWAFLAWFSLEK